jgi:hypothetical protein
MADVIEIFADGTRVERDFTKAELAQIEKDKKAEIQRLKEIEEKAEAKAAAVAKLEKLGLTVDDIKAILG